MSSVSTYYIKLDLAGLGEIQAELPRVKAPHTSEELMRVLPQRSRAVRRQSSLLVIPMDFRMGGERLTKDLEAGQLAWDGIGKSLLVVTEDMTHERLVTILGNAISGLEHINKMSLSVGVEIKQFDPTEPE